MEITALFSTPKYTWVSPSLLTLHHQCLKHSCFDFQHHRRLCRCRAQQSVWVCVWWCFCLAVIEPCLDSELTEFPLRMRDWLKNVLVTLYERDEDNNLLTEKQKLRVRTDRLVDLFFILFTINCHHFRRQSQTQMFQVSWWNVSLKKCL